MKNFFSILPIFICFQSFGVEISSSPKNLSAKPANNLLGLSLFEYSFSWEIEEQTGYRLLMASDRRKLDLDVGDLWDSGKRHSS